VPEFTSDAAPDEEEEHVRPLSDILRDFVADSSPYLTLDEIVAAFGRRSFGALLFVFSTPNLLPLPPGSSTVLGAPLLLIAPQVAIGVQRLWLPRRLGARRFDARGVAKGFGRMIPWLERIERVSRPRLTFFFGPVGDRILGLTCTLLGVVLIFPIPFGNMLPAAAIGVLSLSLVLRDGALALLGYGLAAASWGVLALAAGVILRLFNHALMIAGVA
jgi:hypothetical protein